MSKNRIYLDHNATSPLRPAARAAMLAAMDAPGNASSVHAEGRAAKSTLEQARATIAKGLGTAPRNVAFTSGATEAANLVLTPMLQRGSETGPVEVLLVGAGEHPAVLMGHRFPAAAVERVALTPEGALSLPALEAALARLHGKRFMVALQAVNNETGVIQPVREAAERAHAAGGILICDATQAIGRIKTTFQSAGADFLFFSSHKLGGPLGAGALAAAQDRLHISDVLVKGGGQEFGRRAGTENVPAIAGFAAAFEAALEGLPSENIRLGALRDALERQIAAIAADVRFFGRGAHRVGSVSAFAIPGVPAHTLLIALDLAGVAISSGSACSSGKVRESHVLAAMGAPEKEALRVSLGWSTRQEDVEQFGMVLAEVVDRIRSRRSVA
ncbi:aminotransferase class V-fold PLP-dependent enzyme [Methylocystis sp. MJC1]|jgi:cysteine desulfurase|uniref:cysteine desulfurase family protein n=1 Tax=Methylocystis sp. MJC1 TaxID=2654282 RepID=UPI0013ED0800|nr:aminotransferase class V-fold PLP-dependent enzyme [Methylocystis sp. MJC1]KAF2991551.1 Cysteine desulfurase IscS [Methylocystis sp. MJC1]MBU6527210.1 aminotransferase class V-fold PLP-dependent enzyme [Methylocystis sp. MJC1]UZX13639.1 aminotransferase class V-fold PLP-dependent enzyme [Methylocystis sp. MJC1]